MLVPFEPQRVVAALDLGEPIDEVLGTAVCIARRYDAELHLVHVWSPWVAVGMDAAMVPVATEMGEMTRALEEQLLRAADSARRAQVARVEIALLPGTPWEQIVIYAEQHDADLVVSGTHGRTGLERLLVGSVAERVVHESTVPVLVVPRSAAVTLQSVDAEAPDPHAEPAADRWSDLDPVSTPRRMP